ncbi:MAG: type II toxin-antitoxin system HicB family antitoxin [Dehalococcoidia bacterium]|nr:type II toxin-antitoxin system HicB family antitoxin [Dehalococcoidia bacterium]
MEQLEYTVVLDPDEEGRGYTVTVPALPGCISEGDTLEEALENIKDAIQLYVRMCRRQGEPVPRETVSPLVAKVSVAA